jgi:hypothetical protein
MIKDWLKNIYFDGESILDQGSAVEAPEVKISANWGFFGGVQEWLEYTNPPVIASESIHECTLTVTEANDIPNMGVSVIVNSSLSEVEIQDAVTFDATLILERNCDLLEIETLDEVSFDANLELMELNCDLLEVETSDTVAFDAVLLAERNCDLEVAESSDTTLIQIKGKQLDTPKEGKYYKTYRRKHRLITATLAIKESPDRVVIKVKSVPIPSVVLVTKEDPDVSVFSTEHIPFSALTLVSRESSDSPAFNLEGIPFSGLSLTTKEASDISQFKVCRDFDAERKRDLTYEEDEILTLTMAA